jgi:hypothetical protein
MTCSDAAEWAILSRFPMGQTKSLLTKSSMAYDLQSYLCCFKVRLILTHHLKQGGNTRYNIHFQDQTEQGDLNFVLIKSPTIIGN